MNNEPLYEKIKTFNVGKETFKLAKSKKDDGFLLTSSWMGEINYITFLSPQSLLRLYGATIPKLKEFIAN